MRRRTFKASWNSLQEEGKKEVAGWGAFHRRLLDSVVPAATTNPS
jgi:hypothetical protein